MSRPKKIIVVVGTRPEAIKLAPVIQMLQANKRFACKVVLTAQHRGLLDDVLDVFDITPDVDLSLMKPNQGLAELTSRCLLGLTKCFQEINPSAVIAQGDTTTVMSASLASFYQQIPFGHVEAGLRSGDKSNPFPEEVNRIISGIMARWHFAPTETAKENLILEGISEAQIYITGNTVIDALLDISSRSNKSTLQIDDSKKLILMTAHRRENFGKPMEEVFLAVKNIVEARDDVQVLYPVHPNPNVKDMAHSLLGGLEHVELCAPLNYLEFVAAMNKSYLILSDSGGVQEEAPALGKPVLVLRETTERPEAVDAGVAKLVGTDQQTIITQVNKLIDDQSYFESMSGGVSPFGDGTAAKQIVSILSKEFC